MKLIRDLQIYPGFDRRDPDPRKNYGIHGCEVIFYVHNPKKTRWVQFKVFTDWTPEHVQRDAMGRGTDSSVTQVVVGVQPMAADLGYHSSTRRYSDQRALDCNLVPAGKCYYDGSGLNAERVRDIMLVKGSDGVWEALEAYYHQVYDEGNTGVGFGELLSAFAQALEEGEKERQNEPVQPASRPKPGVSDTL